MIVFECPFNPDCDIEAVSQSGFLRLQEAWLNGVVPGDLSSTVESYNGIDEPSAIGGKPRDFADAYRMNKEFSKALESANNSDNTDKSQ